MNNYATTKFFTVFFPLCQYGVKLRQLLPDSLFGTTGSGYAFCYVVYRILKGVWNSFPPTRILEVA